MKDFKFKFMKKKIVNTPKEVICKNCNGTGKVKNISCPKCKGSGKVKLLLG